MCAIKLRHKGNVKFRFFVVPDDGPALLGIQDIEVLHILKTMCEVINAQQAGMTIDSQITWPTSILKCKTWTAEDHRSDRMDTI